MRAILLLTLLLAPTAMSVELADLPAYAPAAQSVDWLVKPVAETARCFRTGTPNELVLANGLVARTFRLAPNAATIGIEEQRHGTALLRGVKPEATIEIDGKQYNVGGLTGQPDLAYLKAEWIDSLQADPAAFRFTGFDVGNPVAPFDWKRVRPAADLPWPPRGVALTLHFAAPEGGPAGVSVDVHYELYDGIPVFAKWLSVKNGGNSAIRINRFNSDVLAVVEEESIVDEPGRFLPPQSIQLESDYAFKGSDATTANRVTQWIPDPEYTTQVNYRLEAPLLLTASPPLGPDAELAPGGTFETFRVFEIIHDSTEKERRGLTQRRVYRTLCPWTTENPIMLHATSSRTDAVRLAIEQSADVGAEMVILSFGSGLDMERNSPEYTAHFKELADYAHDKGVQLGGYSLLASRRISDETDVINPKTGTTGGAVFENSPCLESEWGHEYFETITNFLEETGFDLLEHDGSYPGDICASTKHPGHRGLEDSQWTQWRRIASFYRWCRGKGISLNVPDWYFMNGSTKTAMGYREVNWSLPRERQIILGRQNIYDGTWGKTPSMGWMFVPMVQYHGGGDAATLEPLREHLDAFGAHLAQNFGSGVQACYRGPRWYDADETRALVSKWISWYKQYRQVLDADLVHVRRPDGKRLDAVLHVNPFGAPRGMLMVYNPTEATHEETLRVPLYYTGLETEATLHPEGGDGLKLTLQRDYVIDLPVSVPANGHRWFVID